MAVIHYHPSHPCNLRPSAMATVKDMLANGVSVRDVDGVRFRIGTQPTGWTSVILTDLEEQAREDEATCAEHESRPAYL